MTQAESDALNVLRWGSTVAIVVCHLQQAVGNPWAWVFNVGVQVFFFLSGFLYGGRRIASARKFYRGRVMKLYLPYALWVSVAITLLCTLGGVDPEPGRILRQYLMLSQLPGLNHLWFMMVIFVCYALLPAIDRLTSRHLLAGIAAIFLAMAAIYPILGIGIALWVALYYLGYFCGRYPSIIRVTFLLSLAATVAIFATYGLNLELFQRPDLVSILLHCALGTAISLGTYLALRKMTLHNRFSHLLTNGGGYEVYLIHHIFILGPLSLMALTPWLGVNIVIILLITVILSRLLHIVSNAFIRK